MNKTLTTLITTDYLVDRGRTPRKSVLAWLDDLRARVDAIIEHDITYKNNEIALIQNNFALLAMYIRGVEDARRQCGEQILFALRTRYFVGAIQPWINLIRLDRVENKLIDARKKLVLVSRLAQRGKIHFAGTIFEAEANERRFAAVAYMSETFLLAVKKLSQNTAFHEYLGSRPRFLNMQDNPLIAEQYIIGGTIFGDDVLIQRGLMSRGWLNDIHTRFVGMYYHAVYSWGHGDESIIGRFTSNLNDYINIINIHGIMDHSTLRLIHRSALFAGCSGHAQIAKKLFHEAFLYASKLNDVEYQVRTLYSLERLGLKLPVAKLTWRTLASNTGYYRFKSIPPFNISADTIDEVLQKYIQLAEKLAYIRGSRRLLDVI